MTWHIITGEYPNQSGGVSDYTRQLAIGLAAEGDEIHVWAPDFPGSTAIDSGIFVHRMPDRFGRRTLRLLAKTFDLWEGPNRILVQYVPHSFGFKAMNFLFARWLIHRKQPVWVMFHEVAYPWYRGQKLKHQLLGWATSRMARWIATAAERIFISIPSWQERLTLIAPRCRPAEWLPVPSVVPTGDGNECPVTVRSQFGIPAGATVLGHFGTYGSLVTDLLTPILQACLAKSTDRHVLLVGRNSTRYAEDFKAFAGRVHHAENVPAEQLSNLLAACDVMIQPYPDGLSTRRTSLMASMAIGRPIVSNHSILSEPFWLESGAVFLTCGTSTDDLIALAEKCLANPALRGETGTRARQLYVARFSLNHTIDVLRQHAGADDRQSASCPN